MNNIQIINYIIKHSNTNINEIEIIRFKRLGEINGKIIIDGWHKLFFENIHIIEGIVNFLNNEYDKRSDKDEQHTSD
jgi:hypothetical protein